MSIEISDRVAPENSWDVWKNGKFVGVIERLTDGRVRGKMTGVPGGARRVVHGSNADEAARLLVDACETGGGYEYREKGWSIFGALKRVDAMGSGFVVRKYSPRTAVARLGPEARDYLGVKDDDFRRLGTVVGSLYSVTLEGGTMGFGRSILEAVDFALAEHADANRTAKVVG